MLVSRGWLETMPITSDRQFADPPAVEDVGQAVIEPADEQHHPLTLPAVAETPNHREPLCHIVQRLTQPRHVEPVFRMVQNNAGKKPAAFDVVVLL